MDTAKEGAVGGLIDGATAGLGTKFLTPAKVAGKIASGADEAADVARAGQKSTALADDASDLSTSAQRGIRSLEKRIAEHEQKLADFKANPTPRPGTEGLSKEIQQQSIDGRIRHLEHEIKTFRENIEKLRGGCP